MSKIIRINMIVFLLVMGLFNNAQSEESKPGDMPQVSDEMLEICKEIDALETEGAELEKTIDALKEKLDQIREKKEENPLLIPFYREREQMYRRELHRRSENMGGIVRTKYDLKDQLKGMVEGVNEIMDGFKVKLEEKLSNPDLASEEKKKVEKWIRENEEKRKSFEKLLEEKISKYLPSPDENRGFPDMENSPPPEHGPDMMGPGERGRFGNRMPDMMQDDMGKNWYRGRGMQSRELWKRIISLQEDAKSDRETIQELRERIEELEKKIQEIQTEKN